VVQVTTEPEPVTTDNYVLSTDSAAVVDYVMIQYDSDVTMYGVENPNFQSQHFWSAVKLENGEWYYIDTCYIDIYTECMARDRVETEGDMNHLYFLISDDTIREMYDGNYDSISTLYEGVATDTTYENNSWMYYAASNVYSYNGNFYYAYDSTDLIDMMGQMSEFSNMSTSELTELMNGSGSLSSMMSTDTDYKIVYHSASDADYVSSDGDTDDLYTTLIDLNAGTVYNPTSGAMEENELIQELYAEEEEYMEEYPSLSLTMALYDGVIYFNLSNCVLSYDLGTGDVAKVKEYNVVGATRDTSVLFGGMAFDVVDDLDDAELTVTNPPIAGLAIHDGNLYVDVATTYTYISGKDVDAFLAGEADDSYGWEFQESNYNPNYNSYYSTYADTITEQYPNYADQITSAMSEETNDNDEFMWSANFTDTISMSTVTSNSLTYSEVSVDATCVTDAFTENRSAEGLIEADSRVEEADTAVGHHWPKYDETYFTEDEDTGEKNTGTCYVCTICGKAIEEPEEPDADDYDSDEEYQEAYAEYEEDLAEYNEAVETAGHTYAATEDGITWALQDDGSYTAAVTELVCSSDCINMTSSVLRRDDSDTGYTQETVYNRDVFYDSDNYVADAIEITLDEALDCEIEITYSGSCDEDLVKIYNAYGPEGSAYEGMLLGTYEVEMEAAAHVYAVDDDDWSWTTETDADGNITAYTAATATKMTCTICGDEREDVEAVVTPETTDATCEEDGETVYTAVATVTNDNGDEIGSASTTATVVLTATGHAYGDVVWGEWEAVTDENGDILRYEPTATRTCANDESHVITGTVTVTSESDDATCTEAGTVTYTATAYFAEDDTTYLCEDTYTTTEVKALGHQWSTPEWDWSDDYSTATATFTCERECCQDEPVIETLEASQSNESITVTRQEATCEEDGYIEYTATVTLDGVTYTDTKTVVLEATGHNWGETVWGDWTEDEENGGYTITATRTCATCGKEDIPEIEVTSETTLEPTCTEEGTLTYTATATYSDNTEATNSEKTESIDALGHTYGEPTWKWEEDYSAATATFTCEVCGETLTLSADIKTDEEQEATCTEDGYITYGAIVALDSVYYNNQQTVIVSATGHTWGNVVWGDWTEDTENGGYTITATRTCENDSTHVLDGIVTVTPASTDATCTQAGTVTYSATATFDGDDTVYECETTKTVTGAALGHTYGDPTWTWSEDYSTATATFTCVRGDDAQTVTATVASETTAATCTADGAIVYTATAEFDGTTYTDTQTEVIPATGHTYGEPVFAWNGYDAATATFTCTDDGDVQTVDAVITSETTAATATEDGEIVYTATVEFNGIIHTDTKTEVIPATGHTYGDPVFTWNGYGSAVATFTCVDDGDVQTVDAAITSETTAATCEEDGATVYTATVQFNGATYTDTQTEVIAATGHTVVIDAAVAATYVSTGLTEGSHCSVCGKVLMEQEVVPVLEYDTEDETYDEDDYSEDSWAAYIAAKEELEAALDDRSSYTNDEILDLIDALEQAEANLTAADGEVIVDTLAARRGNTFYISYSNENTTADLVFTYGRTDDEVLVGDWDGDGVDTICVRRGNTYYFTNELGSEVTADYVLDYGRDTDEVLVGDWDGDGIDTLCVRRGVTYYFSNDATFKSTTEDVKLDYGRLTDEVLTGDWDNDGKDTLCVRRGVTYYFSNDLTSTIAANVLDYGRATDTVLVGDWDGDGYDTLCARRGVTCYFSNDLYSTTAASQVDYGRVDDEVFVGKWR